MDRDSPYNRIRTADPEQREKIYAEIYDGGAAEGRTGFHQPTARRNRRLAIYADAIGPGHQAILELGCGSGDLTCVLAKLAQRVVGIDLSSASLLAARERVNVLLPAETAARIEFMQMNAVRPEFPDRTFDYAVSTSMIEHLHPEDVDIHLREIWRVLKPGGHYLVWCPNRLGHHQDRPYHLSMMSYRDLTGRMIRAGFGEFRSPLFTQSRMVSTRFKILMEDALSALRTRILWSHLGVRNILVVAVKSS
jgi:ubiquinone/menaquinone biosynthesis C-methylase UbiE